MAIVLSGTTGIDAGSLPVANTGKISAGAGLPAILNTAGVDRVTVDTAGNVGIGTTTPARKLEVQSYGVGAAGILRISGLAGSGTTTNASLLELSITGGGGGTVTQNLTARYNNGYEIATYFADRVSWRDNATNTQLFAIDSSGNALVTNSTGGLGYGTGAGGTVTQLTSKSTAVVLNKPVGTITTHNATMTSGAAVSFSVTNTLVSSTDTIVLSTSTTSYAYTINCVGVANGFFIIRILNNSTSSLSENIAINFTIIKGVNA